MIKHVSKWYFLFAALVLCSLNHASAQRISLSTAPPLKGGNGQNAVTFNIYAHGSTIIVDTLYCSIYGSATGTAEIWYRTSAINGKPPALSAANGWISLGTASMTPNGTSSTVIDPQKIPIGLNLKISKGSTYGFCITYSNVAYTTYTSGVSDYSDNNIIIQTGTNVGYGSTTFGNHPRQFNGKVVYRRPATSPDNSSIESLISPVDFCPGRHDVKVRLVNNGNNKLNNVKINWQLDGVTQTAVNYSTAVDTFGSTAGNTAVVTLGTNVRFVGPRLIKVWTSDPNGKTDTDKSDDTIKITVAPAIGGVYTINKNVTNDTNYQSFAAAIADLYKYGVCGPATFLVAPGTYNERIVLGEVSGASAINTISFIGDSKTTTEISNSGTSTANMQTILLDGGDYFRFKNFTIRAASTTYGIGIHLTGNADYNIFEDCDVIVDNTTTTNVNGIIGSGSATSYSTAGATGNFNIFRRLDVEGGYYGVRFYGPSSTSLAEGNIFDSMNVHDYYYYGIYVYYNDYPKVRYNTSTDGQNTSFAYGIYVGYCAGPEVIGNYVDAPGRGMYYYYNNTSVYKNVRGKVINNIIKAGGYYGIYAYQSDYTDFFHNTIVSQEYEGIYFYGNANTDMRNNIIVTYSSADPAVYAATGTSFIKADYNIYYAPNSSNLIYHDQNYSTLAAWKAGEPTLNMNSLEIQPDFVSSTDLHLNPNKAQPYGASVGVTNDIDDQTRCVTFPTIGADENNVGKSGPYVVKFFPPTIAYQGSYNLFTNSANPSDPKLHEWYIDGVFASDSVVLYTNKLTGLQHTIKLITVSCGGRDTFEQVVNFAKQTKTPVPEFIADRNNIIQGQTVRFHDLSDNGPTSYKWEITPDSTFSGGNLVPRYTYTFGDDAFPNPAIRFDYPGVYKVCLTAANSIGTSSALCKTAYITVTPSINLGSVSVVRDTSGYLYDDGGVEGFYLANSNKSLLIDPCASEVYLVFNKFDLECGFDYLRIYDGSDNTGTPLHFCTTNASGANGPGFTGGPTSPYCASNCLPLATDTFIAKSGKMYIEMTSDAADQYAGFEAHWWSKPTTMNFPDASFTMADTACINGVVNFTNTSQGDNMTFYWDLDGDLSTFECVGDCKTAIYPYFFPGSYTITMIAENCGGIDTFTKELYIKTPPSPTSAFTVDNTNPTTNDIVFLRSEVQECVDEYKWSFKHSAGGKVTYMNGTKNTSEHPQVMFSDTGCYTVQLYVENVSGNDSLALQCFIKVRNAYCIPSVADLITDIGISQVEIIGGNNTVMLSNSSSQAVSEYQNFTPTVSATLEVGVEYDLIVSRNSTNNKATRTAWIDWNRDGVFTTNEKVGEETNASTRSWTQQLTVPKTASLGATVMRIAINQGKQTNTPCGQNLYGEYEDYRIYITPDLTAPVITLLGQDTVILEQGDGYTDAGATAWDNLNGDITGDIVTTTPKLGFDMVPGTYMFIYNVKDSVGNRAETVTRVVIITADKTAPELEVAKPDTVYVAVGRAFTEPAVIKAFDKVDGDMSGDVVILNPVDVNVVDTYTVVYTLTDFTSNTVTVNRTVIVIDSIKPVITLTGSSTINHEVNTPYTDAGATVTDNYYTNVNDMLIYSTNVNVNKLGTYVVLYNVTDPSGNMAKTVTRTVNVVDTKAPVISLAGDTAMNLEVFDTYKEEGWSAVDNYGVASRTVTGTFYQAFTNGKATMLGNYTIIYTATDSSGNTTSVTRTINVVDTKAPIIKLNGEEDVIVCRWKQYVDAGYTVSDNYDPISNIKIDTLGTYQSTQLEGIYVRYYRATDLSNNSSVTVKRTIFVRSPEACGTVGINSNTEFAKNIQVYPNPSQGMFMVNLNGEVKGQIRLSVTNMLGQEVAVVNSNNVLDKNIKLDLSTQPAGMYLLNIKANGETITKRLIISK